MSADRIVAVYSAANAIEAHEICGALDDEGIQARVVGEELAGAAGGLPLGVTIAPRIWVFERDKQRAREVIAEWTARPDRRPEEAEGLDEEDWDEEDPVDEESTEEERQQQSQERTEEESIPSDTRFRWLSQGFYLAGLVCLIVGCLWAWRNWTILAEHPAVGIAHLIEIKNRLVYEFVPTGAPDIPVASAPLADRTADQKARDAHQLDAKRYFTIIHNTGKLPAEVTIHYDPKNPGNYVIDYIVGSVVSPWWILIFAVGLAGFFSFVGYQFR